MELLLKKLQPEFWFSAHLHVKYPAIYQHVSQQMNVIQNPDEILIDDSDDNDDEQDEQNVTDQQKQIQNETKPAKYTKFLALDKILPKREFLQIIQVDGAFDSIQYDEEWLAIIKVTNDYLSFQKNQSIPLETELERKYTECLEWVHSHISIDPSKLIPPPFTPTASSDCTDDSKRMYL